MKSSSEVRSSLTRCGPAAKRELKRETWSTDLVVAGGGLSGVCAAVTAARQGVQVVLVQDRPVLGGNSSSEVRLWILGASSHLGNNNRWAREGGVIDEILVENLFRNPEGNPVLVDALLLELVAAEANLTLLLDTAVIDLEKAGESIRSVRAFCSQNSTEYLLSAPLFLDATGDGLLGFLAGGAFRMGAEGRAEFGEGMAPPEESAELLGHSIYFYTRNTGRPVKFVPPAFALDDITRIPRYRDFNTQEAGCKLWWIEYGGLRDTVHDSQAIKWELWKVVYGVWNHLKNSGQFPDAANLTLEWVGLIPGKRESRRFEGDVMLTQRDVVEQRTFPDAVSFGGWAIDLHPADGVYSPKPGCAQYHSKGVYQIPYRALYSRNVANLLLGGRLISSSHVAFGSTRVMATCGHNGQAVGMAAVLCGRHGVLPRDLTGARLEELQRELLSLGQHIPGVVRQDPADFAQQARLTASSTLELAELPPSGRFRALDSAWAMMLPLSAGPAPRVTFRISAARPTRLRMELRISGKPDNHTPEVSLGCREADVAAGEGSVELDLGAAIPQTCYGFYILHANPEVQVALSERRVTGVLAVTHTVNHRVAQSALQSAPPELGVDTFEFWTPERRPGGQNLACQIDPPLAAFAPAQLANGISRPTRSTNAWAATWEDAQPSVTLSWPSPRKIGRIGLVFDTDFDHPMESVLVGHPEREIPFCVAAYRIFDGTGRELAAVTDNHQTRREHRLATPIVTDILRLELTAPRAEVPAALFEIRVTET